MSYKNPNDYEFDWGVSPIKISGSWMHYNNGNVEENYVVNEDKRQYYCNIFNAKKHKIESINDYGGNVNINGDRISVVIPRSGLYKVHFYGSIILTDQNATVPRGAMGVLPGTLNDVSFEFQLIRNIDTKVLSDINFNNKFSRDNINQDINDETAIFPQPHRVNFIDPKQDKNFICGFSFGRHSDENYRNPINSANCNPMAIKGGRSWDFASGQGVSDRAYSAVYSPNYRRRNGVNVSDFTVSLLNADTLTRRVGDKTASGELNQVVWLDKGDKLDLITTTRFSRLFTIDYILGYIFGYGLEIQPFNHYLEWLKMDNDGSSTAMMNWNDKGTFIENQIDLIKSLPSEMKVNDWIDNFCKAFNLILYNTGGNSFNLDIKDKGTIKNTSIIIDLDKRVNVDQSSNEPLNLPYVYELGFTVDPNEEGYYSSMDIDRITNEHISGTGEDGGGIFETGSQETTKATQTSNFSYCWYKDIKYTRDGSILKLPVITDKEIWVNDYDYKEMVGKQYFDKALRFWYRSGIKELDLGLDRKAMIALVSNNYKGINELNYRNEPNTIMSNYFLLLTNQKYYTVVECYLTPKEYSNLDISLVRFNGDLYNVAEIDGYDPLGRRKCTLKLIRKI